MAEDFSYSFNAKRIKVKQKDNGDYRFTFKVGHSSNVSSLSKRPARQTYYFTISHFEKEFDSFFPGSKPNASLNFWDKGESQIMVHKIKSMKVNKKSKVIIDIDPLQLLGSFEALPELIGAASFFVDSGSSGGNCKAEDDCFACEGAMCIGFPSEHLE